MQAWIEEINSLEESCSESEEIIDQSASSDSKGSDMSPVEFIREKSAQLGINKQSSESQSETESPVTASYLGKRHEELESPREISPVSTTTRIIYLQMEFVEGETLTSYIAKNAIIPTEERWKLFRQILEALAYSHGKGVIHGDLRPDNIYVTKYGVIKLANFSIGLSSAKKSSNPNNIDLSASVSIDLKSMSRHQSQADSKSLAYRSPENEKNELLSDKCDIYALGIILLEMSYPLKATEKRELVISNLKKKLEFPLDFDTLVDSPKEVKGLIQQCLILDPIERPNALSLLESDLLPKRIEDEEFNKFIRTIKNPKTMESQKLMSRLFLRGNDPEIEFIDDDPNLYSAKTTRNDKKGDILKQKTAEEIRPELKAKLIQIFDRHSAGCIEPNMFYPYNQYKTIFIMSKRNTIKEIDLRKTPVKSPLFSENDSKSIDTDLRSPELPPVKVVKYTTDIPQNEINVKLLDPGRLLYQGAYSLHIPWARLFAKSYNGSNRPVKRYAFGNICEYHEHGMTQNMRCCFDITSEMMSGYNISTEIIHEAEIIKVTDEIFAELYGKDKYIIKINSTHILDCMFTAFEAKSANRIKLYQMLKKEIKHAQRKAGLLESAIQEIGKKLNLSHVKLLFKYLNIVVNNPTELETKILEIFAELDSSSTFVNTINHLKQLYIYCEGLKVNVNRIIFDSSLMPDDNLIYHSGLYFNVVALSSKDAKNSNNKPQNYTRSGQSDKIAAVGGRFDNTLYMYGDPARPLFGVGVEISCESFMRSEQWLTKIEEIQMPKILLSFKEAFNENTKTKLKDCILILQEIWKRGIPTEADYFISQPREKWLEHCKIMNFSKFVRVSSKKIPEEKDKYSYDVEIVNVTNSENDTKKEDFVNMEQVEDFILNYVSTLKIPNN